MESSSSSEPNVSMAYIAFYSDVEHEVTVVESGYRVTLTYNLYFTNSTTPTIPISPAISPNEIALKDALSILLDDDQFLPEGGVLGFGLSFQYPIKKKLNSLFGCLKGRDATIERVCDDLSLAISLRVVYDEGGALVMLDEVVDLSEQGEIEGDIVELLREEYGGIVLRPGRYGTIGDVTEVQWVTPLTTLTSVESEYIAYGNEASLDYLYGNVCLIVEVGKPGKREKLPTS
jgi:hypothetical protein